MADLLNTRPRGPAIRQEDADEILRVADSAVPARGTPRQLPDIFMKGIAISVWQNSGGANSNWGRFCEATGKCLGLFPNIMDRSSPNDGGTGFWDRYKDDIKLAKDLGVNAFRLSIEWHRIEPRPGVIDHAAIKRYHEILDAIEDAGMYPNATLHHFVHPDWWDKRGAFEKEENLPAFLDFCKLCAKEFGPRVHMWSTFNEPTCFLVCGYLVGCHPPGKLLQVNLMGTVLLNMLKAHAECYKLMKELPETSDASIGLVHHSVEFMPYSKYYFWLKSLTWWGTFWWGRDTVLNFLQTGEFEWWVPLRGKTIDYKAPEKPGLDWWGINYYTRGIVGMFMQPTRHKAELMTDMGYQLYPQGLYENIVRGSALKVPMYISEIGCADASPDDYVRRVHVESTMGQLLKAIRDGYDVRGVYYWTLVDNFEWNMGYKAKFGVYDWDPSKPTDYRKLKDGGRVLAKFFETMPTKMSDLYKHTKDNIAVSDYEAQLEQAYEAMTIMPVVWNKGKCVSCKPLSPLHLRIGLHDIEEQTDIPIPHDYELKPDSPKAPLDVVEPAHTSKPADLPMSAVTA